ncbi:hypothetical protein AaE_004348 [Aphanomyces astaci]|uniref:Uncharacterized protein n=1 Tax=Aphanomyces astaci TaxID=112090 RepID=A0A6A5ARR1_APHAT|nr:hypothetical protein AaE_004348 [Aphanomyces astaci]
MGVDLVGATSGPVWLCRRPTLAGPEAVADLVRMFECHLNTLYSRLCRIQLVNHVFTSLNATLSYNELAEWSGDATTFAAAPLCFAVSNDPGYLCPLAGIVSPCQSNPLQEAYHMSRNEGILAIVMTRVQSYDINTSVCDYPAQPAGCVSMLETRCGRDLSQRGGAQRQSLQYVEDLDTGALDLVTANIVAMGPFSFYTWHFLYHWTKGYRDVLSFEGDVATITVRTSRLGREHGGSVRREPSRPRGGVEFIETQPRGGGLPHAHPSGNLSYLPAQHEPIGSRAERPWRVLHQVRSMLPQVVGDLQTIIVSAEVCWHTYILNDVLSVVTKGYTRHYCHGAPAAHRAVDGPD